MSINTNTLQTCLRCVVSSTQQPQETKTQEVKVAKLTRKVYRKFYPYVNVTTNLIFTPKFNFIWSHVNEAKSLIITSNTSVSKITKDKFSSDVYEDKVRKTFV